MKTTCEEIIVVEGTSDKVFLESFLDAEIVTTNGSDVPRGTIDYLSLLSKTKKIIVLTDPDTPGKRIRDVLDQAIPGLSHAFVRKANAIKKGKVGVAESTREEVMSALATHLTFKKTSTPQLTSDDLYRLGIIGQSGSASLRQKISERLHLGYTNGKTFLKRANSAGLGYEDLVKAKETI